jgi:hypothetical protein
MKTYFSAETTASRVRRRRSRRQKWNYLKFLTSTTSLVFSPLARQQLLAVARLSMKKWYSFCPEARPFHRGRVFRRCVSGKWYCRSGELQIQRVNFLDTDIPHDERRAVEVKAVPGVRGFCHIDTWNIFQT